MTMNKPYQFLRRIGYAFLLSMGISTLSAAPISPSEALSKAQVFIEDEPSAGALLKTPGVNKQGLPVSVVYTGKKNGQDCFYVVNTENGFVIVAADTRLNEILGYSDQGQFNIDKISPDMKWWLDSYCDEISSQLPYLSESSEHQRTIKKVQRQSIAPMLKTQWNQDAPYNNTCPMDNQAGQRSVTGCVATAMAQIMKYHEWPKKPTGSNGGIVFSGTTLDWDNMLDTYVAGKYNVTQATAVATLMRQCGAGVDMHYSYWGSGAYDNRAQYALFTYFGYASDIQMVWKDYTLQKDWNNIIYNELTAGRPVYYSGSSSYGGHAFVCDGYSANEDFHFNWGWGGCQDGYYLLTALNPETGGAGSYEGGYNSHQSIITGIRPSKGETVTQTSVLSTGSFYYSNGRFIVEDSIYPETSIFYNPLYKTESLFFGIKIVNADNPDVKPTYTKFGSKVSLKPSYGSTEFVGSIPTMPDGTYHVYGVYSEDGNNWSDIEIPIGKQRYVTMKMEKGKQTISNDGPDKAYASHLIMGEPYSAPVIPASAEKIFRIPFVNTGLGDFLGEIGISLFGEGDFGDVISVINDVSVPGESGVMLEFTSETAVEPGDYQLYVTDSDGNMISDEYVFTISEDRLPSPGDGVVSASNLSPQSFTEGDERMLMVTLANCSKKKVTTSLGFVFVDAKSLKTVTTLGTSEISLDSEAEERISIGPVSLSLKAGNYLCYIVDADNNVISNPSMIMVESKVKTSNGLCYVVTDEAGKRARIVNDEGTPYSGVKVVPSKIDGYAVEEISQNAFAFSSVTEVTIPTTVTTLQNGSFCNAVYLHYLHLPGKEQVRVGDETFNEKMNGYLWVDAPVLANTYARGEIWSAFNYPSWDFDAQSGTSFTTQAKDPSTGEPYSPYYVGSNQKLSLGVSAPAGQNVRYLIEVGGESKTEVIDPSWLLSVPALGWNKGRVTISATTDKVAVETINADDEVISNLYSIEGILLKKDASRDDVKELPRGIYIWNNKKIIKR